MVDFVGCKKRKDVIGLGSIAIEPIFVNFIHVGDGCKYTATYTARNGDTKPLYTTWHSTHPGVAYVDDGTCNLVTLDTYTTVITLTHPLYPGVTSNPVLVTVGTPRVYVVDAVDLNVRRYNLYGMYLDGWNLAGANAHPAGISVDGIYMYVSDSIALKVYRYTLSGAHQGFWDLHPSNTQPINMVSSIFYLHVLDAGNLVYSYDHNGAYQDNWPLDAANNDPVGIGLSGYVYTLVAFQVVDRDGRVYEYDYTTHAFIKSWLLIEANANPVSCFATQCSLWVLDANKFFYVYTLDGIFIQAVWDVDSNDTPVGATSHMERG